MVSVSHADFVCPTQVDVYYIHAPDRRLPFEEMLEGVDQLYKAGAFRRL